MKVLKPADAEAEARVGEEGADEGESVRRRNARRYHLRARTTRITLLVKSYE